MGIHLCREFAHNFLFFQVPCQSVCIGINKTVGSHLGHFGELFPERDWGLGMSERRQLG